jgi:hypothetical protein
MPAHIDTAAHERQGIEGGRHPGIRQGRDHDRALGERGQKRRGRMGRLPWPSAAFYAVALLTAGPR